jgi:two-component system NtrC family sensor kinase
MEEILDNNDLSTELFMIETLLEEQNSKGDEYSIPMKTIEAIRNYVKASDLILILFDPENPGWANKKLLGEGLVWKSETAFLVRDSVLHNISPQTITLTRFDAELDPVFDPALFEGVQLPVRSTLLAPLITNQAQLGALVIVNPMSSFNHNFFQLLIRGLANALQTAEYNRQLVVNNADLEASHWQILNSRNTLRTFFDNIPSSVFIIDRSYNIIAINNHRSERIGKKPQELVGEKCYEKLRGQSAPCAKCRIMEAFSGIPSVRTSRELGPNDTFVHWEITNVPIREEDNVIDKVIIFEEDVTEKWILEANLIQSEKMASIGQLAANVAHEINNPLTAIIANAQLLLRDLADTDENTIDSLKLIETAGVRAAKIVSNLLDSARREKHYEFEETSLNETIEDAISLLRYEINKRSVAVKLNLSKNIPLIFANKNQLKGVWINLINNALGAIDSERGKISISTRYENKEFYVVLSDNGKGILLEHQSRIFEPFFTTKEAGKGTGLGLSVSLQVIKEHHGDIEFESTPGKGTKFIVILPDIDPDLL